MKIFIYNKNTRKIKSCELNANILYTLKDPPRHYWYCVMFCLLPAAVISLLIVTFIPHLNWVWAIPGSFVAAGAALLAHRLLAFYWNKVEYNVKLGSLLPTECLAKLSLTTCVAFDSNTIVVVYSWGGVEVNEPFIGRDKFTTMFDCQTFVEELGEAVWNFPPLEYIKIWEQRNANQKAELIRNIIERHFGVKR